jgi:hypothetical protein
MGRLAHVVVPGMPHHITQRGNRWQPWRVALAEQIDWAWGVKVP